MANSCKQKLHKFKGSLSVEASICIWIISCFSILIFSLLRIASIDPVIHAIAAETVAEIATKSRIIAIANSIEEEGSIVAGFEGFTNKISSLTGSIITENILSEKIMSYNLPDWVNIKILYLHLPSSGSSNMDSNFEMKNIYEKYGYTLSADDVVLIIEYSIKTFSIRHMAVEKGWVKGSVDIYSLLRKSSSIEPDPGENKDLTVYITKTGTRYHGYGCRYLAKSSMPMKLGKAVSLGYIKCLICRGGIPLIPINNSR